MRTLVTDVVENVAISPVVQPKENILLHTTSVTNRFRSADLRQLLLKEKPFPLNETFLTVSKIPPVTGGLYSSQKWKQSQQPFPLAYDNALPFAASFADV